MTPLLVWLVLFAEVSLTKNMDTFGGVLSTVIVMLTLWLTFPTVSLAKAVTVCNPSVIVAISTVASQDGPLILTVALNGVVLVLNINLTLSTPDSSSVTAALKSWFPLEKLLPSAGVVIVTVGAVESRMRMLLENKVWPSSNPSFGVTETFHTSPDAVS